MPGALGRVALGLLFVTCIHHNPKVVEGHHPGGWQPLYSPSGYDSLVTHLRSTIESDTDSLVRIASRFYSLEPGLEFSFSYAATIDNHYLLLRYFGSIPNPQIFAGYSLQFIFDIDRQRLIKIFVERVPLE